MSQEEISKLEAEELELLAQLRLKQAKKAELIAAEKERARLEEEARLAAMPFPIHIVHCDGNNVKVLARWRKDLQEIWKRTDRHQFLGYHNYETKQGVNLVPLDIWEDVREVISSLPKVEMVYPDGVFEKIEWYLHAPAWEIDISHDGKILICKAGPRVNLNHIRYLTPNTTWDYENNAGHVPLPEGWRIPKKFEEENIKNVVYTDAALLLIMLQVEKRAKIDALAGMEDTDDPRLNVLTRLVQKKVKVKDPIAGVKWELKWLPFRDALEPFQRVGVVFALETNGKFLLADDTGLGKTWQTIAYSEIIRLTHKPNHITVCAVKASNIPNWTREVRRLTGCEPLVIVANLYRDAMIGQIFMQKPNYIIISHETLGTYESYGSDDENKNFIWSTIFKTINADLLIIDEAHQIKNPNANRSQAARQLFSIPHIIPATASPIKNKTPEFWPSLYLLDPVLFNSYETFVRNYTIDGKRPRNVESLKELIKPIFLRRTKAQVLKDLPPINRIHRFTRLNERGEKLVRKAEAMIYERLATFSPKNQGGDEKEMFVILEKILRLIQIAADQSVEFTAEQATDLIDQSDDPNSKVLIFSRFKGSAYKIAQLLGDGAVCTVERARSKKSGEPLFRSMSPEERDTLFEAARHDPKVRYIVTTTASKEGHNIEFCSWVIFNELFWNPEDHAQCEGRAYGRLADPHPIDAIYVRVETDIVDWLWEDIIEVKIDIINEAVEGIESSRQVDSLRDMLGKLKERMGAQRRVA